MFDIICAIGSPTGFNSERRFHVQRPDKLLYNKRRAKARLLILQNQVLQETLGQALSAFDDAQRKRILEAGIRLVERYAENIKEILDEEA